MGRRPGRWAGQQCRHHSPRRCGGLLGDRLGRRHGRQPKSLFFLCQAFARKALAAKREGRIVNIASVLSFQGGIRVASYTASKHGVLGITRLLACEWAAKGINVNAIAPGYVVSNNTEALRNDPDRSAAILSRIPAARWGKPGDIGDAAVFLLAPASAYMHGAVVPVDGGWLAR
jgi:2-deoxy-D-gluconate 3-dehydrogenase